MVPSARGRLFAAILATIAVLAACSGGTATPPSEPAAQYLAAWTELLERGEELNSDTGTTPEEFKPGYRMFATALTAFIDALGGIKYPAAVQADVDTLIGLYAADQDEFSKLAEDPFYDSGRPDFSEQIRALDTRIRAALGLPPPPPPPTQP